MTKTLIVANRLPFTMVKDRFVQADGGLVRALSHFIKNNKAVWLGCGERSFHDGGIDYKAVTIPKAIYKSYYANFSNRVLWLALHGMKPFIDGAADWPHYEHANALFTAEIAQEITSPEDMIWIQDYHLFLLPSLLRQRQITNRVGFFLHVPWPPFTKLLKVPNFEQIVASLLTADLVGFQTNQDVANFLAGLNELGYDVETDGQEIKVNGRRIGLRAFPVSIDPATFETPVRPREAAFYETLETPNPRQAGQKELFALSRLDYTKGIIELLEATETLLADPAWRHVLKLALIPSRQEVPEYLRLKAQIEDRVIKINHRYGRIGFKPIQYSYRKIDLDELKLMYKTADVMVVNSLADGMNVIAKEFVASRTDDRGVLVLSKLAGAAEELNDAILVDPYNHLEVAAGLKRAVTMGSAEQTRHMRAMRTKVHATTARSWGEGFLGALRATDPN